MIKKRLTLALLVLAHMSAICQIAKFNNQLNLNYVSPGFSMPSLTVPYHFATNVPYGNAPAQQFDVFIPQGFAQMPLVMYIHGGGFEGGDKKSIYDTPAKRQKIASLLSEGIVFVSVNYRLLKNTNETEGLQKCLNDAVKALQFLRFHAGTLGIDKDNIGLWGHSAGAGTALWIAFSDDLKVMGSSGPEGQSTRVKVVVAMETQATYDLEKWESKVFKGARTLGDFFTILTPARIKRLYGNSTLNQGNFLTLPAITDYRQKVDMLSLMSPDDPAFWVENLNHPATLPVIGPAGAGHLNHHPFHGQALKEQAESLTPPPTFYYDITGTGSNKGGYASAIAFLIAHL